MKRMMMRFVDVKLSAPNSGQRLNVPKKWRIYSRQNIKKIATVHAEAPKSDYRARPGAFAALTDNDDSSDEDEDTVSDVTVSGVQELLTKERDDAEAVTTTLGGNNTRETKLIKPTWFEMCESDEEE